MPSVILSEITPLSVGVWYVILNIPLFLAGYKIDKSFFWKSVLGVIFSGVAVDAFAPLCTDFALFSDDMFLSAVFGGFLMGCGYGCIMMSGGSSGGSDIIGWLIKKAVPHISIGIAILLCDVVIIGIQGIVYGSIKSCLYATLTLYISSKVMDSILEGINFTKVAYIISDKSDEIAKRIMSDLQRGVTGIYAKGMYSQNAKMIIMCTVSRNELPTVKQIIKETDTGAFVILSDVRETLGEGFNTII